MPKTNQPPAAHCIATTANGNPCRAYALTNSQYCYTHSPEHAAARTAARQRGGQNHAPEPYTPPPFPDTDVTTYQGIQSFIAILIKDAWTLPPSVGRTRALTNLVQLQIKYSPHFSDQLQRDFWKQRREQEIAQREAAAAAQPPVAQTVQPDDSAYDESAWDDDALNDLDARVRETDEILQDLIQRSAHIFPSQPPAETHPSAPSLEFVSPEPVGVKHLETPLPLVTQLHDQMLHPDSPQGDLQPARSHPPAEWIEPSESITEPTPEPEPPPEIPYIQGPYPYFQDDLQSYGGDLAKLKAAMGLKPWEDIPPTQRVYV